MAIIIITICLPSFIGCNSAINEETDYAAFNGEYRFIGCRIDGENEFEPKNTFEEGAYDEILYFNGTNRGEEKLILFYKSGLTEELSDNFEFELNNGKLRFRFDEWTRWSNYDFNNDLLEIKFNPDSDTYWIYKKI